MTRLHYQHVFDELEYMRNYMDSLFVQIQKTSPIALLTDSHESTQKLLSGVPENLYVTVTESDDEVIVTAEMIPGDLKNDIKINLLHPLALNVSNIQREWKKEEKWEYSMYEHRFKSISRIIPLPAPVSEEGSNVSVKNGILIIHLKKSKREQTG